MNIVYNRGMFRAGDVNCFSCSSVDECKDTLIQFGVQDITPAAVARVVGKENSFASNLLSPNIHMQILQTDLYTFS